MFTVDNITFTKGYVLKKEIIKIDDENELDIRGQEEVK